MKTEELNITEGSNAGFDKGLTVEHILLSVTVVSTKESAGQFDDTCAGILRRELAHYHGIVRVEPTVLYNHTKIDQHPNGCDCGICKP